MAQYISKSALVAEIESKIEKYTKRGEDSDAKRDGYGMYWGGVLSCLNEIRTLCDTLEVKEVDFEEYYHDFLQKEWFGNSHVRTVSEMMAFTAKHFFELGMKMAQKGEEV
jgi:hypothetical protein